MLKSQFLNLRVLGVMAGLGLLSGAAQAHTGHGTVSLMHGLEHPFGLDHLLAMVSVGVWSIFALPEKRAWTGPATFMMALVISAALGALGVTVPGLEVAIAASVVIFGLLIALAPRRMSTSVGLGLIAAAASLHGLAHGAEAPSAGSVSSFLAYAVGFLVTTGALHFGGLMMGLSVRRWLSAYQARVLTGMGLGVGAAGLVLLSQF